MSTISAGTTLTNSLVYTGDQTGNLVLQVAGSNTAVTLDTNKNAILAGNLTVTGSSTHTGNATFGNVTITGAFTGTVANTQVTGLITSGQIASVANTQVTGIIGTAQGGTNSISTPTAGAVAYGTGTAIGYTAAGSSGQALVSAGSSAPAFGTLGISGGGTNSTSTPTAGAVAYGTGTAIGYTAAGTSGQVLKSAGTGTPTWGCVSSAPPTCYGAVGTYVIAFNAGVKGATTVSPGATAAGACLYAATAVTGGTNVGLNARVCCTVGNQFLFGAYNVQCASTRKSLTLSGTWRGMTYTNGRSCANYSSLNLWVRVS
jgi:hypothetical protein